MYNKACLVKVNINAKTEPGSCSLFFVADFVFWMDFKPRFSDGQVRVRLRSVLDEAHGRQVIVVNGYGYIFMVGLILESKTINFPSVFVYSFIRKSFISHLITSMLYKSCARLVPILQPLLSIVSIRKNPFSSIRKVGVNNTGFVISGAITNSSVKFATMASAVNGALPAPAKLLSGLSGQELASLMENIDAVMFDCDGMLDNDM